MGIHKGYLTNIGRCQGIHCHRTYTERRPALPLKKGEKMSAIKPTPLQRIQRERYTLEGRITSYRNGVDEILRHNGLLGEKETAFLKKARTSLTAALVGFKDQTKAFKEKEKNK